MIRGSGSNEPLAKTGGIDPLPVATFVVLISAGVLVRQLRRV